MFKPGYQRNLGPMGSSADIVSDYFRTLTKSQIRGLYEMYKVEFEAFEYDYESFLSLGFSD